MSARGKPDACAGGCDDFRFWYERGEVYRAEVLVARQTQAERGG